MAVNFEHSEYQAHVADWDMVDTLCAGDSAVKKAGVVLLPDPVVKTDESSREISQIYERYKQRAMFFNVVGRTSVSLVGAMFRKSPTLETPQTIAYVAEDLDGAGVSIYQQSQSVCAAVLRAGRAGLLVDYPTTEPASVDDVRAGRVRANVVAYSAQQIINWRLQSVGGKSVLALVVLAEMHSEQGEYDEKSEKQLRALRLIDGVYVQELHRKNKQGEWYIVETFTPRMANGSAWGEIPFAFVGAVNNDPSVDGAPLFDLAVTNRKHYQLSADWYNALYFAGQPQPWISGLNIEWRDKLLDEGIVVGSRSPIPLPEGGAFGYATVPADTAIQKQLDKLEEQMVSLGARLVMPGEAAKTATQSAGEQDVSHSVVSLVAENVSDAYTKCLEWMLGFVGGDGECEYRLSGDIAVTQWDAPILTAIVAAVQGGMIPRPDAIRFLQRIGLIDAEKTVEEIEGQLDNGGSTLNLDG